MIYETINSYFVQAEIALTCCRRCGSWWNQRLCYMARLQKKFLRSHKRAIALAFLRICSLAFLFSSFLASISLLETKLIRSAILFFFLLYADNFDKYEGSPHRKGSWLVVQKMAGCSARQEREIVQTLKDVSSIREIENRYQRIKIKDIQQEIDFSTCFVKGKLLKAALLWWNPSPKVP